MAKIPDVIKLPTMAVGSTLVHRMPGAPALWLRANKLPPETTKLLRWRLERWHHLADPSYWVTIGASAAAKEMRIGTYAGALITVATTGLEQAVASGDRQPAVAFARETRVMTGVDELGRQATHHTEFLQPLEGSNSELLGVIVGVGEEDDTIAIGTADLDGRNFRALQTGFVALANPNGGLYRV